MKYRVSLFDIPVPGCDSRVVLFTVPNSGYDILCYIYLLQFVFHPSEVVVIHYLPQLGDRTSCSALNVPAKWV